MLATRVGSEVDRSMCSGGGVKVSTDLLKPTLVQVADYLNSGKLVIDNANLLKMAA